MQNTSKNFCIMPHSHMEISSRGFSLPCCAYKSDLLELPIPLPNVANTSLKNIFENHILWNSARNLSRNDKFNPACRQCHMEENSGLESYRLSSNKRFGSYIDVEKEDRKLLSLELKLGAKCNLACRTCNSKFSNKLLKEDSILILGHLDKDWMRNMQKQSEWSSSEVFWNQMHDISKDLVYIKFTGGEPLIIDEHFKYLEWLVENKLDPEISYITNGTIQLTDRIKNIWSKFSKVTVTVSIDATEDLEEYIRTGCVWEEQNKNINDYVDLLGTDNVEILSTISVLNVHKIKSLIDIFSPRINLGFNILSYPEFLDIRNLNSNAKEYLNSVYNNIINTNVTLSDDILNGIRLIQNSFNRTPIKLIDIAEEIRKKDAAHNLVNKKAQHNYEKLEPDWFKIIEG